MKNIITSILVFTSMLTNAQTFNMVKNVNTSPDAAYLSINCSFREVNGKLYYIYSDQTTGKNALYVTDGTSTGTNMITTSNVNITSSLIVGGNKIYFYAADGINGIEPWVSDGTSAGTVMLKNINPSTNDNDFTLSTSSFLSADSNKAFFYGHDGATGFELWVTDGTSAGTNLVLDIRPGVNESFIKVTKPAHGTSMKNGKLYFFANDGTNGNEPWISDGNTLGTFMLKDIVSGFGGSTLSPSEHNQFVDYNGKMYFKIYGISFGGFALNGLYETDGTLAGTNQLFTSTIGHSISDMIVFNNKIYFISGSSSAGYNLYSSDGTTSSPSLIAAFPAGSIDQVEGRQFTIFNGELYFKYKDNALSSELHKLDANNNIVLIKDIWVGSSDGITTNTYKDRKIFQIYNNKLWFLATDGTNAGAAQIWQSDGTTAGTIVLSPLNNDGGWAGGHLNPYNIFATTFGMFMIYTNPTTGSELYVYNNTITNLNNITNKNTLKLYPNPTTNELFIDSEIVNYTINDINGKVMKIGKNTNQRIDIADLKSGIYFINLSTIDDKTVTSKFIKQ